MLTRTSGIDQNLILTGYIGPGQLAIARQAAERLRLPFVDFDLRLESIAEMTGQEVRAIFGETRLKTLESQVIDEFTLYRGHVLHITGGTLAQGDYLERIASTGLVIALISTLDAALTRLHLALGARYHDPRERDLALGVLRREWAIRSRPDLFELDTSAMTDTQIVDTVIRVWRERSLAIDWRA